MKKIFCFWSEPKSYFNHTCFLEETPDNLKSKTIYIVGEKGHRWMIVFLCPCGCKAKIYLNLLPDARPRWFLRVYKDGSVGVSPSVWRRVGCRSHFYLKRGKVLWCLKDDEYYFTHDKTIKR